MEYKIGQILTSKHDQVITRGFIDPVDVIVPKGNKVIIGADRFGHHYRDGMLQPIGRDDTIQGYDREGIADWIWRALYPYVHEAFEGYEITKEDFIEIVDDALDELGF